MKAWKPSEYIHQFLYEQDISRIAKQQYQHTLTNFFAWCHLNGFEYTKLNRGEIVKYKTHLIEHRAGATVNNHLSILRNFFKWMQINNIHPDITAGIRNIKIKRDYVGKSLTSDQVKQLMHAIPQTTPEGKRNYAMVL